MEGISWDWRSIWKIWWPKESYQWRFNTIHRKSEDSFTQKEHACELEEGESDEDVDLSLEEDGLEPIGDDGVQESTVILHIGMRSWITNTGRIPVMIITRRTKSTLLRRLEIYSNKISMRSSDLEYRPDFHQVLLFSTFYIHKRRWEGLSLWWYSCPSRMEKLDRGFAWCTRIRAYAPK